ncbi:MAG: tRNA (adenosine(37)-N6)-threonylcarbamoyltransferase complex dimerization subunit type 1 TsaB [bacterium]
MSILALDTSTGYLSIAIIDDDIPLYEETIYSLKYHSILLPKEIERALEITKKKIEKIYIAIGPGSFTGLRVGLSVVKGIAIGGDIPVVGVPTFNGLAYNIPPEGNLSIIMKYRLKMAYYGIYRAVNKRWYYERLGVTETSNLSGLIRGGKIAIVKENYKELLDIFPEATPIVPRASLLIKGGEGIESADIDELKPMYIEPAEVEKTKR